MLVTRFKFVNVSFAKETCQASQSAQSLASLSISEPNFLIYSVRVWPPVLLRTGRDLSCPFASDVTLRPSMIFSWSAIR